MVILLYLSYKMNLLLFTTEEGLVWYKMGEQKEYEEKDYETCNQVHSF